jgi:hypothetical protein
MQPATLPRPPLDLRSREGRLFTFVDAALRKEYGAGVNELRLREAATLCCAIHGMATTVLTDAPGSVRELNRVCGCLSTLRRELAAERTRIMGWTS